jgi:hypothetical protein
VTFVYEDAFWLLLKEMNSESWRNRVGRCGLDASGSGYEPVAGPFKHSNELSGSIKGGEFLH